MHVLVTGGAGYIGSHTCLELLHSGHQVTVIDNLANSSREALRRVEALSGRSLTFHEVDLLDLEALRTVFRQTPEATAVIHFAGLKAVGESVRIPLRYYQNNLIGTLNLCQVMAEAGVRTLVFSSSATVYGDPASVPIREDFPLSCTNPYGRTKLMIEEILRDLHRADPTWRIGLLRYFNPVGARPSGRIGEDPGGIPNNLMPYIAQVAVGRRPKLSVFGGDYPTVDGTGVRDYIHVMDLAHAHVRALEHASTRTGALALNVGTGQGCSVLELVRAFEQASGRKVPHEVVARRPGDVAELWADPARAKQLLGWSASRGIEAMCADTWRWQRDNPEGYA